MRSSPGERFIFAAIVVGLSLTFVTRVTICAKAQVSLESHIPRVRAPGDIATPKGGTVSLSTLRVPARARQELKRARAALDRNKSAEAEQHAIAALQIYPDFAEALTFHAFLLFTLDRNEAAIAELEHAIRADPAFALAYLVKGAVMNRLGRFDEALLSLQHRVENQPFPAMWAFEMSKACLGQRDYAMALLHANRAIALRRHEKLPAAIHVVRGVALEGLKENAQSAMEFQLYLAEEPNGMFAASARKALTKTESPTLDVPPPVFSELPRKH